ncbi:MAG: cobalamin biosynthesis protein [Deltaproteobacteria bacterium]|jgi:cobalamin biosynthesis protein CbiG|nr:cobalamin biosynthesis protein [Deltaproteobacteria bacterium]
MTSNIDFAVYALTEEGARLAARICKLDGWTRGKIFLSAGLRPAGIPADASRNADYTEPCAYFDRLAEILSANFNAFSCHILICASGTAVRALAPLLRGKTVDPAVLLLDQQGKFVISLLSGHLGGANRLAVALAGDLTGSSGGMASQAVITTASDSLRMPAIDVLAQESDLHIVNPGAIRHISAALLNRRAAEAVALYDPDRLLNLRTAAAEKLFSRLSAPEEIFQAQRSGKPLVLVNPENLDGLPDQAGLEESGKILILQSKKLWLGLGCKKNTSAQELRAFVSEELLKNDFRFSQLLGLASIDLKKEESGLKDFAANLRLPLIFFSADELDAVKAQTPSSRVKALTGTASVCEAAALLAAGGYSGGKGQENGRPELVLSKRTGAGMTLALASV